MHYSEKLITLPGIGVCYTRPLIPSPLLRKTRQDFGLREDSVVYLCCQSVFKFLPQNDHVFAEIAQRVSNAQFVFTSPNETLSAELLARLRPAFEAAGRRGEHHCVILPHLHHLDYWNLHLVGDIFLDTIGWSSGGSVFEAIACRVPVVTLHPVRPHRNHRVRCSRLRGDRGASRQRQIVAEGSYLAT
jgi:predicted O-linked N-acetylglucosamine transferase (SPINDLY family)